MVQPRPLAGSLLLLAWLGPARALPAQAADGPKKSPAPAAAAKKPASARTGGAGTARRPEVAGSLPEVSTLPASKALPLQTGQGTRKVEPPPAPRGPASEPVDAAPVEAALKGKAPKKPATTLPPGAARRPVDTSTRRQIAGGATDEDLRAGKDDPELAKVREAERVLFPRPLPGMSAGWSWDVPPDERPSTEVSTTGLPPDAPGALAPSPPSTKDTEWLRGFALPNLPLRYDERVLKYLKFYRDSSSGKAVAKVWAKKRGRYEASIRAALARAGLPTDLVWLSLIESGHNPLIVSPAGAAGLWQFMPETARTYGLTVDRWVDERMDPERSTEAAVRFLSDLHRRFGNWELAMAAYNMGHGGLSRAVKKFNSNDFWELARHEAGIPWETTLYVPKILATAIVMSNPKSFGIDGIEPDPAESFDVIEVGPGVALSDVARAAGVDADNVERLNPAYLAGRTPPAVAGRASPLYRVRVPRGKKAAAGVVFNGNPMRDELIPYSVRQGDTPSSIARATGASEATVRSLNRVGAQEVLAAGTVLVVPRAPDAAPAALPDEDVVVVTRPVEPPPGTVRMFYPVVPGDTLVSIARSFGVERSDLLAWNAVDASARLQEGMLLQVFPKTAQDLRGVRAYKDKGLRVLVAGSPAFYDYFEGLNGKRRLVVTVKEGDTLASIGRRYDTSVGSMERINRRSRSDRLVAGERVVVYASRARYPAPTTTVSSSVRPVQPTDRPASLATRP